MTERFLIQSSSDPIVDPRLFLHDTHNIFKKKFCVDFTTPDIQTRIKKNKKNPEPLIRACGLHLKPVSSTHILDLTAGFGLDGFLLSSFSPFVKITLLEKNEIIYQLLNSGLKHASLSDPNTLNRCQAIHIDHQIFLNHLIEPYDIIYLDPMFPVRTKSARVKKYAELLQLLTDTDSRTDLPTLLSLARQYAKKRVVLKRPKSAPILDKPTFSLLGSRGQSCRFDIYLSKLA